MWEFIVIKGKVHVCILHASVVHNVPYLDLQYIHPRTRRDGDPGSYPIDNSPWARPGKSFHAYAKGIPRRLWGPVVE
jgi:hypothetical protein